MLDRTRPALCFLYDAVDPRPPEALWGLPDDAWRDVDLVQIRGKDLDDGDLETLARGWLSRLSGVETRVIVNDRLDVALSAGVHGAHLGREDLPIGEARKSAPEGFLLGSSCHSRDELLIAQAGGADYAGLGAFFTSRTKSDALPLDPWRGGLMERIPALTMPVLAIGGLTPDRVEEAFRVPAVTGVAASAAIQRAEDPAAKIAAFRRELHRAWDSRMEVVGR